VVANFVIREGDPRGDTSGGPGYAIRDDINRGGERGMKTVDRVHMGERILRVVRLR
jgi:cyclophilin family peptidyl-prolyl cis-trans isomerase